jgi:Holliday junction DNA helicase RuvA
MYAYISGTLEGVTENYIIVDNQGIGYQICVSAQTITSLPAKGSQVQIFTEFVVSENTGVTLYGFLSQEEKDTFLLLNTVSGVGPKAALAILSVLTPRDLRFAIISEDEKEITRANGVGPKAARRIILELKDKVDIISEDGFDISSSSGASEIMASDDVLLALTSLGYSASEALRAINSVVGASDMDQSVLLKEALKKLAL